ncbi:MAG: prephenate dehydratase [Candidatus Omnitrophica bacterium]|nr:prephenate dehydratase [Candidatus Omnitrophota bacterium]
MSIKNLRKTIDSIDKNILQLLNKRANMSLKIGKVKIHKGTSIYAADREREILKRLSLMNKGPMTKSALEAIYREVMSSMLALEKPIKIAYLGPEASFTHLAAIKKFGSQVDYIGASSIGNCFALVDKAEADYGVVPIENSIEGAVSHTMDMLTETDLKICSQALLEISHNLLMKYPNSKIKRIYSNPQVFGQCRIWLQTNLSKAELMEVSSSSKAAQIVSKEKNAACIASTLAAKIYNLKIVSKAIEDSPHNMTRFLVIGKNDVSPTGNDKTSVVFSIQDKVGALCDMLVPFKENKLNLTKIESRPSKRKAWDYYFFLDLEGHRDQAKVKKALNALAKKCKYLKVLGSYPV